MQLENFITGTIKSIVCGVASLNDFAEENNSVINPQVTGRFKNALYTSNKNIGTKEITTIKFSLALVTTNGDVNKNNAKEYISILSPKVENKHFYKAISRIKFDLNIVLPNAGLQNKVA